MWRQRILAKAIREREARKLLDRPPEPIPPEPPPPEQPDKASASGLAEP